MMKSNIEAYLQAMINDTGTDGLPTPKSRIGKLLYVLCGKLGLVQSKVATVEAVANTRSDWFEYDPAKPGYIGNRTHYTEYAINKDAEIEFYLAPGSTGHIGSEIPKSVETGAVFYAFIDNVLVHTSPIANYAGFANAVDASLSYIEGGIYVEIKSPKTDRKTGAKVMDYAIISTGATCSYRCGYAYPTGTVKQLDEKYIPDTIQRVGNDVIISSSTAGSTKKFKLTVDDTGAITATEVTEE